MAETIIVGVTCDVKQEELVAHCRARAEAHTQKAAHWKQKLADLLDKQKERAMTLEVDQAVANKMSGYGTNPYEHDIQSAQSRARGHEEKAKKFTFWAEHLPVGATFRLRMSELDELELTSR